MASKIDDDERTNALGLFNTARSYWRSAEHLSAAGLEVTHPRAPVTFLFCHAIELKPICEASDKRHRTKCGAPQANGSSGSRLGNLRR